MVDFAAPAKAGAVFFVVGQNSVRPSTTNLNNLKCRGFSIILHNNVYILKKCLLKQKNKGKGGVGGRQKIDKNNAKCYTEK